MLRFNRRPLSGRELIPTARSLRRSAVFACVLASVMIVSAIAQTRLLINQLNSGATLTGSELIPMYQGGNPAVTTTPAAIKAYVGAGSIAGLGIGTGLASGGGNLNLQPSQSSTIGGVKSIGAIAHFFLTDVDTTGAHHSARPACADLSDAAASCNADATNATNIGSGTLNASRLPSTAVTPGSYTNSNITVDATGRVTAAANGSSSGGIVLLNTLTASSSASLSDTTSLTSTFSQYEIVFENLVSATTQQNLELQVHSGGAFKATGYLASAWTAAAGGASAATTFIPLTSNSTAGTLPANAAPGVSGRLRVITPSTSGIINWFGEANYISSGGVATFVSVSGFWNTAGVVDGFQVLFASGNITSGAVKIYGIP